MKTFLQRIVLLIVISFSLQVNAQRYLTEIFDSYQVINDVAFGVNVNPLLSTYPDPAVPDQMAQWQSEMDLLNSVIDAAITNPDTISSYLNFFYPNNALPEDQWTMVKVTRLEMDIYMPPATDDVTNRPVFVNVHTGNFLPPLFG